MEVFWSSLCFSVAAIVWALVWRDVRVYQCNQKIDESDKKRRPFISGRLEDK